MVTPELDGIAWRKSSYSTDTGECVEVGWPGSARVGVRDSKQVASPTLAFPTANWRGFLTNLD
ncbi:MAG TPA: DUF397 domain-containing protein [Pseudonocardiaceae bacterium]|jgi:hypothetical protein|nr:DUF397 domain-containing protein [Pseudonocardiaceae bacterium]